jgi:type IV secretory pathway VirB3-like protein
LIIKYDENSSRSILTTLFLYAIVSVILYSFVSWLGFYALERVEVIKDYNFWDIVVFASFLTLMFSTRVVLEE